MSLVQTPNVDCVPQRGGPTTTTTTNAIIPTVDHPRLSSKRKLDDYGGPAFEDEDDENDAVFTELVSVRMRKDEPNAVHCSSDAQSLAVVTTAATEQFSPRVPDARSASYACSTRAGSTRSESRLQFFIRTIPDGKTRVIQAYSHDTVRSVHEKIQLVTGIPVHEQRLYIGESSSSGSARSPNVPSKTTLDCNWWAVCAVPSTLTLGKWLTTSYPWCAGFAEARPSLPRRNISN
ncbi:E3 ubiquitin-protein ligase UPL5 [Morella rubra]|uniref:E3 ubiquitin-protein ligase UPL5 n=1 Tax=Morella rubra TaxID=262757 RepID=A0A6A1UJA9_9ROSI|nr:E3 ubiquitin-protein ligase UPL5 [Morella rubra]